MRLLHTTTRTLSEFFGKKIPRYAILSHTWGEQEVSFQDLSRPDHRQQSGYSKIDRCCALAASDGWDYVWIDTCCIDKTSSAELSEAINSMYRWYANAEVCYVYLSDFCSELRQDDSIRDSTLSRIDLAIQTLANAMPHGLESFPCSTSHTHNLGRSRWFKRGWTLQELLAPQELIFYDQSWTEVGTKRSLRVEISQITSIQQNHLSNPESASIAAKMSWASYRETTREEDLAYCLMGLFRLNMPLLYGEGASAFTRLQHEIIAVSDDESVFAWEESGLEKSDILARSPEVFAGSRDIVPVKMEGFQRRPYSVTNKGLAIDLLVVPEMLDNPQLSTFLLHLNCAREGQTNKHIAIKLTRDSHSSFTRKATDWKGESLVSFDPSDLLVPGLEFKRIYVRLLYTPVFQFQDMSSAYFYLRPSQSFYEDFSLTKCWTSDPCAGWDNERPNSWEGSIRIPSGLMTFLFQKDQSPEHFLLLLFANRLSVSVDVVIQSSIEEVLTLLSKPYQMIWNSKSDYDRRLKHLQRDTSVSVKLKKEGHSGEARYRVDLDIARTHGRD